MGFFNNIFGIFSSNVTDDQNFRTPGCDSINPANGLPMIEDSCIDIEGNPYGTDSSSLWESSDSYSNDDLFDSFSSNPFDDSL